MILSGVYSVGGCLRLAGYGRWAIVDYKTDDVSDGEVAKLVDHYRPQVRSYAEAWEKLVQQPVHEVGLFFTRTNSYLKA